MTHLVFGRLPLTIKRSTGILSALVVMLAGVTIIMDYAEAGFRQSGFYFSESLLFSSFWLLFIPLLHVQLRVTRLLKHKGLHILTIPAFIIIHLLVYPALVWLLSAVFFPHTFSYIQTLGFGLPQYFIVLALGYTVIPFINRFFVQQSQTTPVITVPAPVLTTAQNFVHTLTVTTGKGTRVIVKTDEIIYITASSPYIHIYQATQKFVHTDTLKQLEKKLDNSQFVRIHRSCIVNVREVVAYKSRLNGDYDLTLSTGIQLRLSRHYAPAFKAIFDTPQRVTG